MKHLKSYCLPLIIILSAGVLPACKSKKPIVKPPPPVVETKPTPPPPAPKPAPAPTPPPPPPAPKPDYNFKNIQFEFNSGILKTDAYPILDKAVVEMKKDPSVKFQLDGHSSAEGTDQHNMELSVERANSVKTYLVNSGISADNLSVKGYGESKPVAPNTTEENRALNRRVEIHKQ
ncbi:OmpA family protein [Mucilaginibacter litoreus]|uniref:OmpA family protein n=1 Tax=Mucilaginibacter litoreus TaxID=1048221 RepID=A0ABW3AR49_9SPHI